jgi:hypothetical protein
MTWYNSGMTVQVRFKPETEAKLLERAKTSGKDIEHIILEAVEEKLGTSGTNGDHQRAERIQRLRKFLEDAAAWGRANLPPGHFVDDSRESIYSDDDE